MGGWCKERYNKGENNKLEGLHQKPDQMEETRWEGQNFSEVVAPQEEEEVEDLYFCIFISLSTDLNLKFKENWLLFVIYFITLKILFFSHTMQLWILI
jgi:hypothetical protein